VSVKSSEFFSIVKTQEERDVPIQCLLHVFEILSLCWF